jgi:hypothetical protein
MPKPDFKSPDAIRVYMFLGAAVLAFLLSFLLVVPILKNTCTWFKSRCSNVVVTKGPSNALLIQVTGMPYSYYYDGNRYIFAYGDNLFGSCPSGIYSGLQPEPVPQTPIKNFCYKFQSDPRGEDFRAVCVDFGATCAEFPNPVTVDGKTKYQCPDKVATDEAECCKQVPDLENPGQCARLSDQVAQPDGTVRYSCDNGKTTTDTIQCCEAVLPCPGSKPQYCQQPPIYNPATKTYSCPNSSTVSTTPECCACTDTFVDLLNEGTEYASGQVFQPVFAVDAKTMKLVNINNGIVCGMKRPLVEAQFQGLPVVKVNVNIPLDTTTLNIYQLFDVLKRQGVFKPPA